MNEREEKRSELPPLRLFCLEIRESLVIILFVIYYV